MAYYLVQVLSFVSETCAGDLCRVAAHYILGASNLNYDVRTHFSSGVYADAAQPVAVEKESDVHARAKVRINEIPWSIIYGVQLAMTQCEAVVTTNETVFEFGGCYKVSRICLTPIR